VPIDDSGAPVRGAGGQIAGVVLVFRDVSERREGERRSQRQAEELREQDRRKDEFLAVLAHELRNPLAPIRNAVAVLRLAPPGGERARRAREVIDRQASQMTRLVDDLLDIARITEGKIRLDRSPVRLDEVVQGTVDDHRELFQRKGVALELSGPGGEVWAMADATRLAQVVGNLLQNAAKFTSAGGRVRVSLETGGGQATLRVRDDGAGMDADTLARLFQPFVQADRTLARTQGGLGLGLALARSLVELQGGTIAASSPGIGRGTELVVTLPLVEPPRARGRDGAPLAGARRRVLLIEDNEDAADTLRDVLELDGHEVVLARDGHEGVDAAQAQDPEVVLCDLGLPGLDGFEVARRLRAAGSGAYLVALTGYATPEDAERALRAGFDAHLAKPADLGKLEALLASAPAAERVISAGPWSTAEPREHL
jgi:signal transduction histidine kinase/ActR/RegA family two-component response regulator